MTFEELDKQVWNSHMKAKYSEHVYDIDVVNFDEHLVALDDGSGHLMWVRCENITLVN